MKNINAKPKDINEIQNHKDDKRTLDKLINGVNITTDETNMWLIPYVEGPN